MTTDIPPKVAYLRSLPSIRERCSKVHSLATQDKLQYFEYHPEKEQDAIEFCLKIIQRDYSSIDSIPPHGRWRHLDAGRPRIEPLIAEWRASPSPPDEKEVCRRLIDLFLISVLLDAGAGNIWKYKEKATGATFSRSEGLAVASFDMFSSGLFSNDNEQKHRVDSLGLERLTEDQFKSSFQVTEQNPLDGVEGRLHLVQALSNALRSKPEYFGKEGRPGNLIDYLESKSSASDDGSRGVPVSALWHVLIDGLQTIWPKRYELQGVPLGDVWPCGALPSAEEGDNFVPFHKLTGWTTYSLLEPLQKILKWKFTGIEHMTGLPEYRNGGLLVDTGVLTLKPGAIPASYYPDPSSQIPKVPPSHPAVVEWRAMTVIELDRIADGIRVKLGLTPAQLTLAQVLESATWKGGREIAAQKRPQTKGPPIEIESDGTVF